MPNSSLSALKLALQVAGTVNGSDLENRSAKGCVCVVDLTATSGTPTGVFTIEGKDPVSGKYYTILASAELGTVATTVLRVYPGLTAATNLVVSDILPNVFRVTCVVAGTDTPKISATVGVTLID